MERQEQDSNKIGAVVLCGGKSSRLGMDKTQLIFQGQTFLERVVGQVGQVCAPIVLVGNTDFSKHRLPNSVLLENDQQADRGPLEGMRVGLKRLVELVEFAFVSSCDVPLIEPDLILHLNDLKENRHAIVPVSGNRVFGMTAIYRTSLHEQIGKRIVAGQLRVSDLAEAYDAVRPDIESLRKHDPNLDSMTNVNSAIDYQRLLERFGLEMPLEVARRLKD